MQGATRVLLIAVAAGGLSVFGMGCENGEKANTDAEHPTAEPTDNEHPSGDHPQGEHPEGEHPGG